MPRPERLIHKRGSLVRESASGLAYLADLDDLEEPIWLPKSEVEWDGLGTFVIPEWLAREKGLI